MEEGFQSACTQIEGCLLYGAANPVKANGDHADYERKGHDHMGTYKACKGVRKSYLAKKNHQSYANNHRWKQDGGHTESIQEV